jgi:hypothetical protein
VQYVALIYDDEKAWGSLPDDRRSAIYARYMQLSDDLQEAGAARGGAELQPTDAATTVRQRDARTLVTDGPYAEAKEALGGFFVFEAASMDEAIEWASRIPAAETGAVEVRPVFVGEGA